MLSPVKSICPLHYTILISIAPPLSNVIDSSEEARDIDFQQSRKHVSASWFSVEDPESDIITLTWCVGSRPQSCDLHPSASLDVTATKSSTYLKQPMKNGETYYVTVKASNGAGLTSAMATDGVTVDYTPPRVGMVIDGEGDDIDYLKDGDTVYARWSGFEDPESGIKSYQFALCEKENITACPTAFSDTGLQTNISLSGKVSWFNLSSIHTFTFSNDPSNFLRNVMEEPIIPTAIQAAHVN